MITIGIDLGVAGALSAVDSRGSASVHDLPIIESDSGKRLDSRAFLNLLRDLVPIGEPGQIVTEDVRVQAFAGHRMSHSTETTLVGLRFSMHALADIAKLPVMFVQPKVWKKYYGLGSDKTKAREIAQTLYPIQAHHFKRAKDHNRAESLLLAHYGKTRFE